jgi:hypothetical protein
MNKFYTVGAVLSALFGCADHRSTSGEHGYMAARQSDAHSIASLGVSQADEQMRQFGERHPSCQMWSNWEKLCSRLGRQGRTRCVQDLAAKAEPSAPFCAAGEGASPEGQPQSERVSSERYCTRRSQLRAYPGPAPVTEICTSHSPSRPFNGRRLASLDYALCDAWVDRGSNRTVCTRAGNDIDGVPSCGGLARSGYQHPGPLVCAAWSAPKPCSRLEPTKSDASPEAITIPDLVRADSVPVWGVHCS